MGSVMAALLLNGPSTASISLMLCLFKQHLNFAGNKFEKYLVPGFDTYITILLP